MHEIFMANGKKYQITKKELDEILASSNQSFHWIERIETMIRANRIDSIEPPKRNFGKPYLVDDEGDYYFFRPENPYLYLYKICHRAESSGYCSPGNLNSMSVNRNPQLSWPLELLRKIMKEKLMPIDTYLEKYMTVGKSAKKEDASQIPDDAGIKQISDSGDENKNG